MELAHPAGAESLAPQPSQLASAVASTRNRGSPICATSMAEPGRVRMLSRLPERSKKVLKTMRYRRKLLAERMAGSTTGRGWSKASPLGWRGSVNARKFASHFGKIQLEIV